MDTRARECILCLARVAARNEAIAGNNSLQPGGVPENPEKCLGLCPEELREELSRLMCREYCRYAIGCPGEALCG